MRLILLLPLLLLGCKCHHIKGEEVVSDKIDTVRIWNNTYSLPNAGKYKIIIIDGCEYIWAPAEQGYIFTHKGDCHNPIHKQIYHESDTVYNNDVDTSFMYEGGNCK